MKRPLSLTSCVLLGLALTVLAYNAVMALFALRFPTDNCSLHFDRVGGVVSVAPTGTLLRNGDVITHVDGYDVRESLQNPGLWWHRLLDGPGSGAHYTVVRNGYRLQLWVPWQQSTPLKVLGKLWPLSLVSLAFILSAAFILVSRTRDPAASVVAFCFCLEGLNLVNNAWPTLGANLALATAWFFHPLDLLSFVLAVGAALHALLIFPRRAALLVRWPWLGGLIYLCNLGAAAVGIWTASAGVLIEARTASYRLLYPMAGLQLLVGAGHLMYLYFTSRHVGVRNQIRWLVWGVLSGLIPWLLLTNLPVALGRTPVIPVSISSLALGIVPVVFFFSVTRRGLMVVDTLINRSLTYSGLIALLFAVYLIGVGAFDWLSRRVLGRTDPGLTAFLAIVVVALAADPLRMYFRRLIDRVFYRRWVNLENLLSEVGERLSTTLQLETLLSLLTLELPERLQVAQAALLLRQDDGGLAAVGGQGPAFRPGHPLIAQMQMRDRPLVIRQNPYHTGVLAELSRQGWELLLPLRSGGRLVGLYLLGAPLSGDLYGHEEVHVLHMLGHQVAATLENTRLYSEIERYSQDLEALVAARTSELAVANCHLTNERDRLNAILQNMADGLLVTGQDGRILLTNPALEAMLHRPALMLLDRSIEDAETIRVPGLGTAIACVAARPGYAREVHDFTLDGRVFKASITALGDRSAVITLLRDATHEVEVDRMKSEFVSTVSHELRTPLTAVLGFAKLIGKAVDRDVAFHVPQDDQRGQRAIQRIRENLDIIVSEGERLTRLINDVLDIAKMEAGKIEWRDDPCDVVSVIRQAVDNAGTLAASKGVPIRLDLPADPAPLLVADTDRILQVITNLLSNAIKFTERGQIAVSLRLLEGGEVINGWCAPVGQSGVLIAVQDTGVGIPREALPRLFQRFQQIDGPLRDKPKGTGLGLAICREIVTHYTGILWAESELNVGSTFYVALPLSRYLPTGGCEGGAVQDAGAAVPAGEPGGTQQPAIPGMETLLPSSPSVYTVLTVDDEAPIRTFLGQTLSGAGYHVLEAADGMTAIAQARQAQPDLIILDVKMSGLSGLDVTQVLKADPTTAHIPILIFSVDDYQSHRVQGAAAYLTKPVEIEALLNIVARLIAQGAPVEESQWGE